MVRIKKDPRKVVYSHPYDAEFKKTHKLIIQAKFAKSFDTAKVVIDFLKFKFKDIIPLPSVTVIQQRNGKPHDKIHSVTPTGKGLFSKVLLFDHERSGTFSGKKKKVKASTTSTQPNSFAPVSDRGTYIQFKNDVEYYEAKDSCCIL